MGKQSSFSTVLGARGFEERGRPTRKLQSAFKFLTTSKKPSIRKQELDQRSNSNLLKRKRCSQQSKSILSRSSSRISRLLRKYCWSTAGVELLRVSILESVAPGLLYFQISSHFLQCT